MSHLSDTSHFPTFLCPSNTTFLSEMSIFSLADRDGFSNSRAQTYLLLSELAFS